MTQTGIGLSIVIPAYKEAEKIGADIRAASEFLRGNSIAGEIIVVDDGSADGTAEAAASFESEYPELLVLSYERNRGKGHALALGMLRARGDIVMFADSGLCVPYEIATIGIKMLELDMCDIANGSRRMRGSIRKSQPLYRRAGSLVYRGVVHALMGVPRYIADTQCGFKLYKRDVARRLFSEAITDGFMFDVEIILRALKHGYRILEFPVIWSNDADTRYDPVKGTIRNFKELAKMKWAFMRKAPRALAREEARVVNPGLMHAR